MVTTLFGNNLRRVIFLLMVGVFVSMAGAFAAPPVNDECVSALFVTPGVAISGQTFNIEATFAPDDPELSCTMGPGFGSVFFEFVATNTSARVRTDVDSVGLDSDFAVYAVDQTNWCDKSLWTEVGCSEDGAFEFTCDICIEGLTVGHTYMIMLVSFTEGSSGEYTLQIDSPCPGAGGDGGDADGDLVSDADDLCPDTPVGEEVDANGCSASQLDSDGDLVSDADDLCPDTPVGEEVDANGCSASQLDSDGDLVSDADDQCPNTPAGEVVDAVGCSLTQLDSDGDLVSDADDLCPDTPVGEEVDANGCSASQLDSDGDLVSDADDLCPGSLPGALGYMVVNSSGCSIGQQCSIDDDWKNHGQYVSCVSHAAEELLAEGKITEEEKDAIVSSAAGSSVGKPVKKNSNGKGR